jgi:5-methyltetrahydrofolate--homocysteine methyltransferase
MIRRKKNRMLRTLAQRILILDGAMGTEIMKRTGRMFDFPELLNRTEPGLIQSIHEDYIQAGADIIETNTLGANRIKLREFSSSGRCRDLNLAAAEAASKARAGREVFIAGSIGPTGKLIRPLGEIEPDEILDVFSEQAEALADGGVDFFLIETQIDILEAKLAAVACRNIRSLPIAVSMTFPLEGSRTVTGSSPEAAAVTFASGPADIYGINCGRHPKEYPAMLDETLAHNRKPLIAYANAGEPEKKGSRVVFPLSPDEYAVFAQEFFQKGARIIGGCCGTTPQHISKIAQHLKGQKPVVPETEEKGFRISSRNAHILAGPGRPLTIVGENINPFASKKLDRDFRAGQLEGARRLAREQEESGAHALDLNLGKAGEKNPDFYAEAVRSIQSVTKCPLFLDNSNPDSLEKALLSCGGKPVINSVNAETHNVQTLLPLAKKYGAGVVLLAMDEDGIPESAGDRCAILENLIQEALSAGLSLSDLIMDPVTLALSASSPREAKETLKTLSRASALGIASIIGLSNFSFGLPLRGRLNQCFLIMAMQSGLDAAILNPRDTDLMELVKAADASVGRDKGLRTFTEMFSRRKESFTSEPVSPQGTAEEKLFRAVLEGERNQAEKWTRALIETGRKGLDLLENVLSPALRKAGDYYEKNIYFLPQLIMSAEAMETASGILEKTFPAKKSDSRQKKIILATVKGDLHDIGKNIVALVLRNSGLRVIDLGKNVDAEKIIATAEKEHADVIALSALMTTALDAMEDVIRIKEQKLPRIKVVLGGAAVSNRFAQQTGADAYGKDAMDALKKIETLLAQN